MLDLLLLYALIPRPALAREDTIASVAGVSSCFVRVRSLEANAKRRVIAAVPSSAV